LLVDPHLFYVHDYLFYFSWNQSSWKTIWLQYFLGRWLRPFSALAGFSAFAFFLSLALFRYHNFGFSFNFCLTSGFSTLPFFTALPMKSTIKRVYCTR